MDESSIMISISENDNIDEEVTPRRNKHKRGDIQDDDELGLDNED